MSHVSRFLRAAAALSVLAIVLAACSSGGGDNSGNNADGGDGPCTQPAPPETLELTLAAYTTPREVYGKIIPAFQTKWKEEHDDQNVIFNESYAGSTTQAANIIAGFEADVVALSLAPDVDELVDAGLITHDWTALPDDGMVSSSVVVFYVRPGNPKGIENWDDLAEPGAVEILTPDPASSGGARWNIVSAWGAALNGYAGVPGDDEEAATELLNGFLGNVLVFDKGARDSVKNFESGNGDVAITYENEVKTAQDAGQDVDSVYPESSVFISNPAAVVDANVDKHCVREVAEAFVEFLHTPEVKEMYTNDGFLRSTDIKEAQKGDPENGYPEIPDLWDVAEFGGWTELNELLFSDEGIATKAIAGGGR